MRKKISESIWAKTFISMLVLLVVCCIIIYSMVMVFLPKSYKTELESQVTSDFYNLTLLLEKNGWEDADKKPLKINTEGAAQTPEGYENAGKVVANGDSENDSYFTEAGFELTEGNAITSESESAVLLHEKFAERNGLSVGDTMQLSDVTDEKRMIDVTVVGIFM